MAAKPRRARGTASDAVGIFVEVAPDAKAVLDEAAAVLGQPKWRVMEEILRHVPLDADGRPAWWPDQLTPQEELPLKSA